MSIIYCDVTDPVDKLVSTLQVMRKKTGTEATTLSGKGAVLKTITKKPRAQVATQATRTVVAHPSAPDPSKEDLFRFSMHTSEGYQCGEDGGDDGMSATGSRERSSSPLESDLLRYLTVHIAPPSMVESSHRSFTFTDVTSFVIERDEYLQGIIRLIQSDCPEVVCDIQSFTNAMQKAFTVVTAFTQGGPVTNFHI
jgi:hypothetical protein